MSNLRAKISNYDPESGYCEITIGNRQYELDGIDKVIGDHWQHNNMPVPNSEYLSHMAQGITQYKLNTLLDDIKESIKKAETPIWIA